MQKLQKHQHTEQILTLFRDTVLIIDYLKIFIIGAIVFFSSQSGLSSNFYGCIVSSVVFY